MLKEVVVINKGGFSMKQLFSIANSILLILVFSTSVFAHSGRTDTNGGHNKTSDGTYHYHSGSDRGTEYLSPPNSTPNPATMPASAPNPVPASAPDPLEITVMVDKEIVEFDQEPIMLNNRVLVPIRYVAEKNRLFCRLGFRHPNGLYKRFSRRHSKNSH